MTTDALIACPDPNCPSQLKIVKEGIRKFSHAETTVVPLTGNSGAWSMFERVAVRCIIFINLFARRTTHLEGSFQTLLPTYHHTRKESLDFPELKRIYLELLDQRDVGRMSYLQSLHQTLRLYQARLPSVIQALHVLWVHPPGISCVSSGSLKALPRLFVEMTLVGYS